MATVPGTISRYGESVPVAVRPPPAPTALRYGESTSPTAARGTVTQGRTYLPGGSLYTAGKSYGEPIVTAVNHNPITQPRSHALSGPTRRQITSRHSLTVITPHHRPAPRSGPGATPRPRPTPGGGGVTTPKPKPTPKPSGGGVVATPGPGGTVSGSPSLLDQLASEGSRLLEIGLLAALAILAVYYLRSRKRGKR